MFILQLLIQFCVKNVFQQADQMSQNQDVKKWIWMDITSLDLRDVKEKIDGKKVKQRSNLACYYVFSQY